MESKDILKQLEEKLTSFKDACKIEGLDPEKVIPSFEHFPEEDIKAMKAHAKWVIMVKAANRIANGGNRWFPDFTDGSWKYEIWWWYEKDVERGSSGFRFGDDDGWRARSGVGSRLCFIDRIVAKYLGENFPEIWNEYAL